MKIAWLLYILVYFNDDPKIELYEYATEQQCEQEKVTVIQEIKEVYNIDAEAHCLYTIQSDFK